MQCMETSHGKTSDGPILFVCLYAVIAFHKSDDVFKSSFVSTIHSFWNHKLRLVEVFISLSRRSILDHVAIGHHDDHGFGFAFSDQVV